MYVEDAAVVRGAAAVIAHTLDRHLAGVLTELGADDADHPLRREATEAADAIGAAAAAWRARNDAPVAASGNRGGAGAARYVPTSEAAHRLNIKERTARHRAATGQLAATKHAGRWLVEAAALPTADAASEESP